MNRRRLVLVAYDVNTETPAGRRRLRLVAQICCGFGVRVQKSVFECLITEGQISRMTVLLRNAMDETVDSLRLYRLTDDRRGCVAFGVDCQLDLEGLLIV
ncbi:MAG: CRISPR-associated endonuclease Cas2 [Candidatus Dormibacteraceae bacterium]